MVEVYKAPPSRLLHLLVSVPSEREKRKTITSLIIAFIYLFIYLFNYLFIYLFINNI